jgi:ABC-type Fe3+-siderophore transport system permease subunit
VIRIVGAAFGVALVASFLSNGNEVVIGFAFFGALALIAVPLLTGQSALRCPACRKRVKLGAAACHHCGRTVTRNA